MSVEQLYSLGQVTKALEVSPRQVQWLREKEVVVPHIVSPTGGRCLYAHEDVVMLFVALTVLAGCSMEIKRGACAELRDVSEEAAVLAAPWVHVRVDMAGVREQVRLLLHVYEGSLK